MTRIFAIAVTLAVGLGTLPAMGAAPSAAWEKLIRSEAGLAQEMTRMDTLLAYLDLADRIAVIQGRLSAADADARLRNYGQQMFNTTIGEPHLAEARARLGSEIAGYLDATARAAASSNRWPGGAAMQTKAQRLLDAVRSSYPRFLQKDIDPTLLIMQVALVDGWARGESAVANPFAGHLQRMQAAYPAASARARIAAAAGPLVAPDGKPVPAPSIAAKPATLTPPPRQGAGDDLLQQIVGLWRVENSGDVTEIRPDGTSIFREVSAAWAAASGFKVGDLWLNKIQVTGGKELGAEMWLRFGNRTCGEIAPIAGKTSIEVQPGGNKLSLTIQKTAYSFTQCKWTDQRRTDHTTLVRLESSGAAPGPGAVVTPPEGTSQPHDTSLEMDTDRPGLDLTSFDLQQPDPDQCMTACQDYGGCRAFTYVKPGVQGPLARCWLKSAVPTAVRSSCCISGLP